MSKNISMSDGGEKTHWGDGGVTGSPGELPELFLSQTAV